MFTGYNSEVEYDGKAFHVQTEDKGLDNPVVESRVYRGGEVVASVLTSYADLADSPDYTHDRIQRRVQEQHQSLIEDLQMGRLEAEPKIRRKALTRVLDPDNLIEEYVEDWIESSALIEPIHQVLEQKIDVVQKQEVDDLKKKKEKKEAKRSILAFLVVLISIYAAFELGRVSQRPVEPRPESPAPNIARKSSDVSAAVSILVNPEPAESTIDPVQPVDQPPVVASVPVSLQIEPQVIDAPTRAEPRPPAIEDEKPGPDGSSLSVAVEASPVTIERPAPDPELEPDPAEQVAVPPVAAETSHPGDGPFEADEVDRPPTSVATQLPVYTAAASRAAHEGHIRMRVLVGVDGSIDAVRVLDETSDSDLNNAAISSILHWRFNPGSHRGFPVPVWVPVQLDFSLQENRMRSVVTVTR